jgi:valyl-tRNA synthetase
LPIDPRSEPPAGFDETQRDAPGGFTADPDVMDTWATSSLTPQIVCGWERDPDLFARTFPMDLHAHAHEIIRTWLFSCVVRSHHEHGTLPWRRTAISGFVVDPDRKKMGKSTGNATTPIAVLEMYGADAVRWRAAGARPGQDTPFDEAQMKVGRRLAMKILNVGRFILRFEPGDGVPSDPLDLAMLAQLADVVQDATEAFEEYDYATALASTERFFWTFCDDYVELVKARAYGERGTGAAASAIAALRLGLDVLLRLFAPIMPFVTEEVWSWFRDGSIHRAAWPRPDELPGGGDVRTLTVTRDALSQIRAYKSARNLSMRAELDSVTLTVADEDRPFIATDDLSAAGRVATVTVVVVG